MQLYVGACIILSLEPDLDYSFNAWISAEMNRSKIRSIESIVHSRLHCACNTRIWKIKWVASAVIISAAKSVRFGACIQYFFLLYKRLHNPFNVSILTLHGLHGSKNSLPCTDVRALFTSHQWTKYITFARIHIRTLSE